MTGQDTVLAAAEDAALDLQAVFGAAGRLPFAVLVADAEPGA